MILREPDCDVLTGTEAVSATQTPHGWRIRLLDPARGDSRDIAARNLVIATGAHQPPERVGSEVFDGFCLRTQEMAGNVVQSGDVLKAGGLAATSRRLAGKPAPRIAVVGGSTSAAAVVHALLNRMPDVAFGEAGITLLHRRPLRVYYPDVAAAGRRRLPRVGRERYLPGQREGVPLRRLPARLA